MGLKFLILAALGLLVNQSVAAKSQAVLQGTRQLKSTFESPEHQAIGNLIQLRYPGKNVSGSKFGLKVETQTLSFGDIISLAGDYFVYWDKTGCHESISDRWDSKPNRSIDLAKDNANLLRKDWKNYLEPVMSLIKEQGEAVKRELKKGRDAGQVYSEISNGYNVRFGFVTDGGYLSISLCNYDHFENDAIRAYKAVHSAALERAKLAKSDTDLKEAYFLEAYGQHFMTDLFSAGHIRTPRRKLHSTGPFTVLAGFLGLWPGDQCAGYQHNEDSANGLWVTNALGQSWAAYGDTQLFEGRSAANRRYVVEASQMGVDEIWQAFQLRQAPDSADFAALKKVPIPASTIGVGNFVPLFERDPTDKKSILFRSIVDDRSSSEGRKRIDTEASNAHWGALRAQIENGGPIANMYTFTRAFKSVRSFLHLGLFGDGSNTILVSAYGNVDSGSYGKWWSMLGSASATVPKEDQRRSWTDASAIGDGIISLVARLSIGNKKTAAQHVGLGISPAKDGRMSMEVLWTKTEDDGNSEYTPGQILFGSFDSDSKVLTMVKYFGSETKLSKIEAWVATTNKSFPPTKLDTQLDLKYVNFLIPYRVQSDDVFSTLVSYGRNMTAGYWYFASWKKNYTEKVVSQIDEPGALAAQALLSDSDTGRLVRVHYGRRIPVSKELRIDVQRPVWNDTSKSITFTAPRQTQRFEITWPAYLEKAYLLWFLTDVDGDGNKDLVAYTSQDNFIEQTVIVFAGRQNGTFAKPVVSPIQLDPNIGKLLTAEYMLPLTTVQAQYTYLDNSTTAAGIMAFFDNYGIVGARMLAPKAAKGTFKYEFKGQNPSIAGQRSTTLGQRPGDWMGLDKRKEVVGLLPF